VACLIDSLNIATLKRGASLPMGYVDPAEMRVVRIRSAAIKMMEIVKDILINPAPACSVILSE
jgi:hypothetical protein